MHPIVSVSPFRCRLWALHGRLEGQITEATCRAEIESFSKHGQLIPVLGRKLQGDPDYDFELIYGARRLFAARYVNMPLKVELRELSDHEAIIAMDIENRQRLDMCAYERGTNYALWLREGYFKSQDDIARALKVSAAKVSRLLKVSRLPSVIVNAFESPLDIREEWALDLVDALADQRRRGLTVQRARNIASAQTRATPREIFQQLLSTVKSTRVSRSQHDEVVKDDQGTPLFRIRRQTKMLAVLLPIASISERTLDEIRGALTDILLGEQEPSRHSEEQTGLCRILPSQRSSPSDSAGDCGVSL